MSNFLYLHIFSYLSGLLVFLLNNKHLLLMLLGLEFTVISIFMGIMILVNMMGCDLFFSMIFLSMSVCEGALGLGILVMMVRIYGNDHILTFTSLW